MASRSQEAARARRMRSDSSRITGERFSIIDAQSLLVPACHEACIVLIKRTILELPVEHPMVRMWDKVVYFMRPQVLQLRVHSYPPTIGVRGSHCLVHRTRIR